MRSIKFLSVAYDKWRASILANLSVADVPKCFSQRVVLFGLCSGNDIEMQITPKK